MLVLYILGAIILLILVVAAIVGTRWSFERTRTIKAPLDRVWEYTSSLHGMNRWNPWLDRDPHLQQEYTGTDGEPGAKYAWDSPQKNVGAGNQTIVSVTPKTEMVCRIVFIRPFAGQAQGWVRLKQTSDGTDATWGISSSTPYPMNIIKVFGVIEKNMERDFTKGLDLLQALCEK